MGNFCPPGSGSTDLNESGSNPDPDPQPCLDMCSFSSVWILERLQRGKYPGESLLKAVNVDRSLVRPAQTQQESEQKIEVQKLMLLCFLKGDFSGFFLFGTVRYRYVI